MPRFTRSQTYRVVRLPGAKRRRYLGVVVKWGGVIVIGLAVLIAVQLLYPSGLTRPFVHISGVARGFMSQPSFDHYLSEIDKQTLDIRMSDKVYHATAINVGISIDKSAIKDEAYDYHLAERLKPFSLFKRDVAVEPKRNVESATLSAYVDKLIDEAAVKPVNASATKQPDGSYQLVPAKAGISYDKEGIIRALVGVPLLPKVELSFVGRKQIPMVSDKTVEVAIAQASELRSKSLNVIIADQTIMVTGQQLATWASITTDPTKGTAGLTYDKTVIDNWLQSVAGFVYSPATPTLIYRTDGVEQSRTGGIIGRAVDADKTALAIITALADKSPKNVTATIIPIDLGQKFVDSYTPTSQGVQALINNWQTSHGGQTAVYFQELAGQNRAAVANQNTLFQAASVYKLYVFDFLLNGVANHTIDPTTQLAEGKDIAACVSAMILVSDNPCPEAAVAKYGWDAINNFVSGQGLPAVGFLDGNSAVTAAGVGTYLQKLQAGSLLSPEDTVTVLGYMGSQKYRSGIPAGLPAATVQDKVGFIAGIWNDAAIVHSPKGDYVLVVLTNGAGGALAIADLASQLDAIL
ncbi:MAG: serine hydrolase [Candidatus Saccharimonadales bacterium]